MAVAGILFATEDREAESHVQTLHQAIQAGEEALRTSDSPIEDVALLVVKLVALRATSKLPAQEEVFDTRPP